MAIRRQVFESIGGFRDEFGKVGDRNRPEDTDLCMRAAEFGGRGKWIYDPDAGAYHQVPAERGTLRYFLRRCFNEGQGKAALASLNGISGSTSEELMYVRRVLPHGVARGLLDAVRGKVSGVTRSAMILIGLSLVTVGFVSESAIGFLKRRRKSPTSLALCGARTLTFDPSLGRGAGSEGRGSKAARPSRVAATVLSICRVMARQAVRTRAGAAMGWSCAVRGYSDPVVDAGVNQGEGQAVSGEPVGVGAADALDQPVSAASQVVANLGDAVGDVGSPVIQARRLLLVMSETAWSQTARQPASRPAPGGPRSAGPGPSAPPHS